MAYFGDDSGKSYAEIYDDIAAQDNFLDRAANRSQEARAQSLAAAKLQQAQQQGLTPEQQQARQAAAGVNPAAGPDQAIAATGLPQGWTNNPTAQLGTNFQGPGGSFMTSAAAPKGGGTFNVMSNPFGAPPPQQQGFGADQAYADLRKRAFANYHNNPKLVRTMLQLEADRANSLATARANMTGKQYDATIADRERAAEMAGNIASDDAAKRAQGWAMADVNADSPAVQRHIGTQAYNKQKPGWLQRTLIGDIPAPQVGQETEWARNIHSGPFGSYFDDGKTMGGYSLGDNTSAKWLQSNDKRNPYYGY